MSTSATSTFHAPDRATWRAWLQKNHQTSTGVWLIFFKKHVPKPSIRYPEALEEALCFGWIDNIRKRLDDERYMQNFTPRKPNSRWSAVNLKLVEKLKAQGVMTEAGLAAMNGAHSAVSIAMREARVKNTKIEIPSELKTAFTRNKKACIHFESLAPSHQRMYLLWITSAKREETRSSRIKEALKMLQAGKKLGMK